MKRIIISLLLVLTLVVPLISSCTTPTDTAPPVAGSLEWRLDRLVEQFEQQRQTLHIPGMAIAVVKDDEVILTHGFGVTDIEKETPVTPETLFGIGSSTKAFTTTLIGMLVDEGKMNWDSPITDYLPYFKLNIDSEDENAEVTIRDLLCHRTGFPRMGLLFVSGTVPREEVLQDATAAEPYKGFREKFYYNNVMYSAAGIASGKAAGTDWDTLVTERIFKPLGMSNSYTSMSGVETDSRLSHGYLWDEEVQEYKYKPARVIDNIAPAGSIVSNVRDMAQWVRFQLSRGMYEGKRLISEEQLNETWTSQIEIAPGVSYGMGWMVRKWEEQPVIEHGGNTQGFAAEVALLPESNLGFVLLTNVSVTALQQLSINMVWETLLGEWEDTDVAGKAKEYEQYRGKYIAGFGPLKDKEYTVIVQEGRLALDAAGEAVYELKEPDEEGKWHFVISEDIAISFERDDDGNVIVMNIHQSGLTFEIPRVGVEIMPEIALEELQKYLGFYRSEQLAIIAEILIQNNRLAIDIPGQMVYELYPPDEEGTWAFRVSKEITLKFNETQKDEIDSLTLYQAGQEFEMPRVEGISLPTVDEILALRKTDSLKTALKEMGIYQITGTIRSPQSGVQGTFSMYASGTDRYRTDSDYGKYGYSRTAVNGDRAWTESSFGPFEELYGKYLEQAKQGHPAALFGDWRDFYDAIHILRSQELDGRRVYVLSLENGGLPPATIYVDTATGDVLKSEEIILQAGGIAIPVVTSYEDYREVHGVRIPFRSISSNEQSGQTIVQYETIKVNVNINEEVFILSNP